MGGLTGSPLPNSTGSGQADADAPRHTRWPDRGDEPVEQLLDVAQDDERSGRDVGLGVDVAQDAARQVRERDIEAGGTDIGDQDVARVGAQLEAAGWASAGAGSEGFGDQAAGQEVAHALGDDAPGEARQLADLGARVGATAPDEVEDGAHGLERVALGRAADGYRNHAATILPRHGTHSTYAAQGRKFLLAGAKVPRESPEAVPAPGP